MRRFGLIISVVALVMGLSQCTKNRPNMPNYNGTIGDRIIQDVTLNTVRGNNDDGSKVSLLSLDKELKLQWDGTEVIYVYDGTSMCGTLNFVDWVGEDKSQATFTGTIKPLAGSKLRFYYFNNVAAEDVPGYEGNSKILSRNYNSQNHKDINKIIPQLVLRSDETDIRTDGKYNNVTMKIPFSIVKIKFSNFGSNNIKLSGMGGTGFSIDKTGTLTVNETTAATLTKPGTSDFFTVFMPKDGATYLFSNTTGVAETSWSLEENTYYTKDGSSTGEAVMIIGETPWNASVVTIPVCAIHPTCASSGGVASSTTKGIEEQGVCWSLTPNPTINDNKYVHQYAYEYPAGTFTLTPVSNSQGNTFACYMSGLTPNTTYYYRAYIIKGNQKKYGNELSFTTPSTEPAVVEVDLGLPSGRIWAAYNLGVNPDNLTTAASWYGDYYMWGEVAACTSVKSGKAVNCGSYAYRFVENKDYKYTKYCPKSAQSSYWYSAAGNADNKTVLDPEDDCVRQTLGGTWRLPTPDDWLELFNDAYTTKTYTSNYNGTGARGWILTSKVEGHTSASLFFPGAGDRTSTYLYNAPYHGFYMSNSISSSDPRFQLNMIFTNAYYTPQGDNWSRALGFSARPVR